MSYHYSVSRNGIYLYDTLANLARPANKKKVTRSDFKEWVNAHLEGHPDQPYQYRGKDVYAARCALLHKYGSEAELHKEDPDTIMFALVEASLPLVPFKVHFFPLAI